VKKFTREKTGLQGIPRFLAMLKNELASGGDFVYIYLIFCPFGVL
jgi:hypothetical protein